ncbi:ABC transporter ATP-binding protein [Lentibacillus saliphilus]|uniref:ABC transporter ATP-binding protein n=1 Tax=Lentibacillus saliphilus TaxID=2737028 RepID=UPI001C2F5E35|nr:ABC transporter ATP-binding protein [Lentibacillus saliphilus]
MEIELSHASVQFQGDPIVKALEDIQLTIKQGEWITIVGPSGSGKTTLLNVIGGLQTLTNGDLSIDDQRLSDFTKEELQLYRRNKVGYIYQDYQLFEQFTALENVMVPLWPYMNKKTLKETAQQCLAELNMDHRLHALPSKLSGGEKQRVAIARALLNQPDALLCDEPTGNLDVNNRDTILHTLKDLHQKGMTILFVTHDLEIAKWGDRHIHIRDGKIEESIHI